MGTLDNQKLKRLYEQLLQCRMLAERAAPVLERHTSPVSYTCVPGEEAIVVGALSHLLPDDCIASSRRDLLCDFLKGVPLKDLFRRLRRKSAAAARSHSKRDEVTGSELNIIAPTLAHGSAVPAIMGAGAALAFKLQKRPLATIAFSSDEAAAQGPWQESLRYAALHKLPIMHVVRCSAPTAGRRGHPRASVKSLSALALACEAPAIAVDASDAVAIYRITFESIRRAREGHGPALILCIPCRWDAQKTATMPPQAQSRTARWKPHDPVVFMENYLRQKGLWSDKWNKALIRSFRRKLDEAARMR